MTMLSEDPPIYQFDDFLSAKECAGLIKLGRKELEPSTTSLNRDTDNARTSSTGWLIKPYHERNNIIKNVEQRMAEVMNVPRENQEGFQTLEYKPGQYYRTHHDFIIEQDDWASGCVCCRLQPHECLRSVIDSCCNMQKLLERLIPAIFFLLLQLCLVQSVPQFATKDYRH